MPSSSTLRISPPDLPRAKVPALGRPVIVKGPIFRREDLSIDGEVEGSVELQEDRLRVGPRGKVVANVKAREVIVLGTIHGNVETTDKLEIRREARLVGDIKTARIVIEYGAFVKGNVEILRAEVLHSAAVAATVYTPVGEIVSAPMYAPFPWLRGAEKLADRLP